MYRHGSPSPPGGAEGEVKTVLSVSSLPLPAPFPLVQQRLPLGLDLAPCEWEKGGIRPEQVHGWRSPVCAM